MCAIMLCAKSPALKWYHMPCRMEKGLDCTTFYLDDPETEVRTVRVSEADTIEDLCAKVEELGLEDPWRDYAPLRVGSMEIWKVNVVFPLFLPALNLTVTSTACVVISAPR